VLNQYLRNYVKANKKDWCQHLILAKFCYNSIMHSITKLCLFKLTLGRKSQEADGLSHSHGTKRSLQGSCGDDQRALKNSEETLEISSKAI
jgi:hypothetical protein